MNSPFISQSFIAENTEMNLPTSDLVGATGLNQHNNNSGNNTTSADLSIDMIDRIACTSGFNIEQLLSTIKNPIAQELHSWKWKDCFRAIDARANSSEKPTNSDSLKNFYTEMNTHKSYQEAKITPNQDGNVMVMGVESEDLTDLVFIENGDLAGNTRLGDHAIKIKSAYADERSTFDSSYKRMNERTWNEYATALTEKFNMTLPYVSFIQEAVCKWAYYKLRYANKIRREELLKVRPTNDKNSRKGLDFSDCPEQTIIGWDQGFSTKMKIVSRDMLDTFSERLPIGECFVSHAETETDIIADILAACAGTSRKYNIFGKNDISVVFPSVSTATINKIIKNRRAAFDIVIDTESVFWWLAVFSADMGQNRDGVNAKMHVQDLYRLRDALMWAKVWYRRSADTWAPIADMENGVTDVTVWTAPAPARIGNVLKLVLLPSNLGSDVLVDFLNLQTRLVNKAPVVSLVVDRLIQISIGHWSNILVDPRYRAIYPSIRALIYYVIGHAYSGEMWFHTHIHPKITNSPPDEYGLVPNEKTGQFDIVGPNYTGRYSKEFKNMEVGRVLHKPWETILKDCSNVNKSVLTEARRELFARIEGSSTVYPLVKHRFGLRLLRKVISESQIKQKLKVAEGKLSSQNDLEKNKIMTETIDSPSANSDKEKLLSMVAAKHKEALAKLRATPPALTPSEVSSGQLLASNLYFSSLKLYSHVEAHRKIIEDNGYDSSQEDDDIQDDNSSQSSDGGDSTSYVKDDFQPPALLIMTRSDWLRSLPAYVQNPIGDTRLKAVPTSVIAAYTDGVVSNLVPSEELAWLVTTSTAYNSLKVSWNWYNETTTTMSLLRSNGVGLWNYRISLPALLDTVRSTLLSVEGPDWLYKNTAYTVVDRTSVDANSGYNLFGLDSGAWSVRAQEPTRG